MAEPDLSSPSGPLAALLVALTALAGATLEYIRRRTMSPKVSQLDRIEAAVGVLVKTQVVETDDGGRVATGRRLTEALSRDISTRLDQIEKLLARRTPQLAGQSEKLEELGRNVDSLAAAVQSAVELMERRIKER